MTKKLNTRATAAKLTWQIIDQGQSLDSCIAGCFKDSVLSLQDRAFAQELVYGVCRWYGELDAVADRLLRTPIRNKDRIVHYILLVGLYQLSKLDTAPHAAVAETVNACKQLNKQWAKNLINGCLRSYQRHPPELNEDVDHLSHPAWIRNAIHSAWPQHSNAIFRANNKRPPMCLRINTTQYSLDDYLTELDQQNLPASRDPWARDGVIMTHPCPVSALPGFADGACSVQDTAAQLAADILAPEPGMRVLDACAAPGGKTAHLLERCDNQLRLDALDISASRCEQLRATLKRLHLTANVYVADASLEPTWATPENGYSRILVDAPCSGLGVVRRHPDIKHHRRQSDIETMSTRQLKLLSRLWPLLERRGRLLYMTCSILPTENELVIQQFLATQNDAMLVDTPHPNALHLTHGVQTLPGVHEMDGFYYCLLEKESH